MKPGDTIGKYTIDADLGEGGMGRVYVAHDGALDRKVALKLVRAAAGESDEARKEANARLLREARAVARLDHPNVVSIFDVGDADGTPFLAMELVKGKTLRDAAADAAVPLERRLSWLTDAARALAAAHRAGLVHRDVKPENVMVRDDGVVKVLDFGIARRARVPVDPNAPTAALTSSLATLTGDGMAVGTPLYMTPEQISGDELDGRTDQFAWAVMAHEVLTGSVPWKTRNEALGLVAAILMQPAPSLREKNPGVSPEVDAVFAKCLSKSPADRFASMDEVVTALAAAIAGTAAAPAASARSVRPSAEPREAAPVAGPPSEPTSRATAQRRYDDDEIREIVARASELRGDDKLSHAELMDVARQMGLDEDVVRVAARELEREKLERGRHGEVSQAELQLGALVRQRGAELGPRSERIRRVRAFFRNLASYVGVNAFIYFFLHNPNWQRWVLFGWGIGLALQLVRLLFPKDEEERRRERERKQGRGRSSGAAGERGGKGEREQAIEQAAAEILRVTTQRRMRVAASGAAAAKVRVNDGEGEGAAELEAAAEGEKKSERKQRR